MTDDHAYTFQWADRTWECRDEVPLWVLKRLAKAFTKRKQSLAAHREQVRATTLLLEHAVINSDELLRVLDLADMAAVDDLLDRVVPPLLSYYGPDGSDIDTYVRARRARF